MNRVEQLDKQSKMDLEQLKEILKRKANFLVVEFYQNIQGKISSVIVQDQTSQKDFTLLIFSLLNKQGMICDKKLAYAQQRSQMLQETDHPNIMKFYSSFQLQQYFFVQLEKFGQIAVKWCEYYQEFLLYKMLVSNVALQILNLFKYLQGQNLCVELLSDQTVFINDIHKIKICNIRKKYDTYDNQLELSQDQNKQQKQKSDVLEFCKFIQLVLEKQIYLDYYEPYTQHKYQISLIQNIKEQSLNQQSQIQMLIFQYESILNQQLKNVDENYICSLVSILVKQKYSLLTQKVEFLKDAIIVCSLKKSKCKIKNIFTVCKILIEQGKFSDALQYINLIYVSNNRSNIQYNGQIFPLDQKIQHNQSNLDLESFKSFLQNGNQNRSKSLKYLKIFECLFNINFSGDVENFRIQEDKNKISKIYFKNQNFVEKFNSCYQILNKINIFKIITGDRQSLNQNRAELFHSLSEQYLLVSSLQKAIFFQRQSVLLNQQNESYRKFLAQLYQQNYDFKSQIKCLQFCFKASQNLEILNKITDSLIKLNLFEIAKQICLYQISLDQNNVNALLKLGIIYLELKNLHKSKIALDRCVCINDCNSEAYLYLSLYFFKKQHYFRSIQNLLRFSQDQNQLPQKRNIIKMNHAIISKKLKETYNIYQSEIMLYKKNADVQSGYLYLYPKYNKYDQNENIHNEIYIRGIYSSIEVQSDQSMEQEDEQSNSLDEDNDYNDDQSEIDCSYGQRQQNQSEKSSQTVQKDIYKNFDCENKQKQGLENQTIYIETIDKKVDQKTCQQDSTYNYNEDILILSSFMQEQQDDCKGLTCNQNNTLNNEFIEVTSKNSLENHNLDELLQKNQQKKIINEENGSQKQLDFPDKNNFYVCIDPEGPQDQKFNFESPQAYQQKQNSGKEQKISSCFLKNGEYLSTQQEVKVDEVNHDQIKEITYEQLDLNNYQGNYYQSILDLNINQQQNSDSQNSINSQSQSDNEIKNQENFIKNSCNLENRLFQDLDIHDFFSLQSIEGKSFLESTSNSCRIHVDDLERVF
ncbi:hypothetical protein ABPG72_010906 [Tetrahymena utriculariae]